ncbi:MAG: sigma-70 family RNA polymerase sigma factor [Phycisphaerales bacterium]
MPEADPRTDEELVEAGNRGDSSALAALYLRHRDWAASLALRFTRDREEALDVMQEAFVYLFGKFPGLVLRARVTTLLYPAVKNIALARARKRRAGGRRGVSGREEHGRAEDGTPVAPGAPGDGGAEDGRSADLAAAVSSLPDGQREVLLMRVVDGMGVAEIAVALGIPEGTVKSRLHHALAALREDPRARRHFLPEG